MRGEMLIEFVRGEVAAVLGLDASQPVPVDTGLFDLGMDSLMSVELKRRLERGAGQHAAVDPDLQLSERARAGGFLDP